MPKFDITSASAKVQCPYCANATLNVNLSNTKVQSQSNGVEIPIFNVNNANAQVQYHLCECPSSISLIMRMPKFNITSANAKVQCPYCANVSLNVNLSNTKVQSQSNTVESPKFNVNNANAQVQYHQCECQGSMPILCKCHVECQSIEHQSPKPIQYCGNSKFQGAAKRSNEMHASKPVPELSPALIRETLRLSPPQNLPQRKHLPALHQRRLPLRCEADATPWTHR